MAPAHPLPVTFPSEAPAASAPGHSKSLLLVPLVSVLIALQLGGNDFSSEEVKCLPSQDLTSFNIRNT